MIIEQETLIQLFHHLKKRLHTLPSDLPLFLLEVLELDKLVIRHYKNLTDDFDYFSEDVHLDAWTKLYCKESVGLLSLTDDQFHSLMKYALIIGDIASNQHLAEAAYGILSTQQQELITLASMRDVAYKMMHAIIRFTAPFRENTESGSWKMDLSSIGPAIEKDTLKQFLTSLTMSLTDTWMQLTKIQTASFFVCTNYSGVIYDACLKFDRLKNSGGDSGKKIELLHALSELMSTVDIEQEKTPFYFSSASTFLAMRILMQKAKLLYKANSMQVKKLSELEAAHIPIAPTETENFFPMTFFKLIDMLSNTLTIYPPLTSPTKKASVKPI